MALARHNTPAKTKRLGNGDTARGLFAPKGAAAPLGGFARGGPSIASAERAADGRYARLTAELLRPAPAAREVARSI
jgi:hypothetical protein